MTPQEINTFLDLHAPRRERTLVVMDFANIDKWSVSLGWKVGIKNLGNFTKHLTTGSQELRRFYYGTDYGPHERRPVKSDWSTLVDTKVQWNKFAHVTKPVKYIVTPESPERLTAKCDLDVEMAVDMLRLADSYDTVVLLSGDGDLMYAICHLAATMDKKCIVMAARGHIGREVIDANTDGVVQKILYADDFRGRLEGNNHR